MMMRTIKRIKNLMIKYIMIKHTMMKMKNTVIEA